MLGIALTLPSVQTKIAHYFTEKLNTDFGTKINIEQVEVTIFGGVKLKKVLVLDHHNDTLIASKLINTTILDVWKNKASKFEFSTIRADALTLNIKTYKNEKQSNFDKFIASFEKDTIKSKTKFLLISKKIFLKNAHFSISDENKINKKSLDLTKINGSISDFKVFGPEVFANIEELSLKERHGLVVENLKTKFTYTKKNIKLEDLDLITENSKFKGEINLSHKLNDFNDFNNKVVFDITSKEALIASNDIRFFYDELGKNQTFDLKAKIHGTLNNLKFNNLHLKDNNKTEIIGDVLFKNLAQKQNQGNFYMKGNFKKVASSYQNLITLLPNILGKKLPTSLKKIGQFNLIGKTEISSKTIDADFKLSTALGLVQSKLLMTNIDNIDNANYNGKIDLQNFDLGTFLNRKELGRVTLNLDVDGKGFTEKYLKTSFSGDIKSIRYNNYTYQNISADGNFKKPNFEGTVVVNDPNLKLNFDGLINLGKKEYICDFKAEVAYANLRKLNFVTENVSVFKGDIVMNASGSSLANAKGEVILNNASYQNTKSTYKFDY